jgi:hypothetical protein
MQEPILLITPSMERVEKWLKLHGLDGPNRAFRIVHQPSQMIGFAHGTLAYDYGESHNFMYLYESSMFEAISSNKMRFTWLEDGVQFLEAVTKWHERDKAKPEPMPEPMPESITVPIPSPIQDTTKWPVDPRVVHDHKKDRTLRVIDLSEHQNKEVKKVPLFQWQDLFWLVIFGAIVAAVISWGYYAE